MKITMIGHSTVLIEAGGQKILTDPYFGGWGNLAFARPIPAAKKRDELGDINIVLVSHNHWDHTDRPFLCALGEDVTVIAPRWATWETKLLGAKNPVGMNAWEKKDFGSITITAVPALHIAVTHGYVIEGEGMSLYFAGDTYYYSPVMKAIGRRFQVDVALMPVTTYRIPMTMDEKSAVRAAIDLNSSVIIPIHLGIRPRSPLNQTSQTAAGFARRVSAAGLKTQVIILNEGESWSSLGK